MQAILPILLDASLKGLAILLVAVLITAVMRKGSAAARHLVWSGAIVAVLTMPALSYLLPGLAVLPTPGVSEIAEPTVEMAPQAETAVTASEQPRPGQARVQADRAPSPTTPMGTASPFESPVPPAVASDRASTSEPMATDAPPARPWWQPWLAWLPWIWLGGAMFALIPLLLGWLSLWQLKRATQPITGGSWQHLLHDLCTRLGLRRQVVLLRSPCRTMPMTWGIWAGIVPGVPAQVLIPEDADEWAVERRRAVLLHELAHIQRRDCLTQMLTQLACALYWFNPLIWYAAHRMLIERERACDDLVLTHATKPSDYAQHLLDIATGPQAGLFTAHAGIAMARRSKLDGRLVAILDQHRNRRAMSRLGLALTITLIGAVAVPVAMLQAVGKPADQAYVADLGDGIAVKLHGVGVHPIQQDVELWSANGKWIGKLDFEHIGDRPHSPDEAVRDGIMTFVGLDRSELNFVTDVSDPVLDHSAGSDLRWNGEPADLATAFTVSTPLGQASADLAVGLSIGPWHPVGQHRYGDEPMTIRIGEQVHFIVSPPSENQGQASLRWRREHVDRRGLWDIQRIAHLKDGRTHMSHSRSRGGFVTRGNTRFPFAPDQVSHFEIQVRPYRYVEFRNVSLQPGHETEVEVVTEPVGADAQQEPASLMPDDAGARASAFGPVVELLVADENSGQPWLLDLDRGALHDMPEAQAVGLERIDLSGVKANMGILAGNELRLVPIAGHNFETVSVPQVRQTLHQGEPLPQDRGVSHFGGAEHELGRLLAFQTREGAQGLLQVLEYVDEPKGVRLRYKLVRAAAHAEADRPQDAAASELPVVGNGNGEHQPAFGPVIERVVAQHGQMSFAFIDLDEDQVHDPPFALSFSPDAEWRNVTNLELTPELQRWVRSQGIDAVMHVGEGPVGRTFGWRALRMMRAKDEQQILAHLESLDAWSASQLVQALAQENRATRPTSFSFVLEEPILGRENAPFITEDGGRGILQITEFTNQPRGVQIRYKLIDVGSGQVSDDSPATSPASLLPALKARFAALLEAVEDEDVEQAKQILEPTLVEVGQLVVAMEGSPAEGGIRSAVGVLEQAQQALEAGDLAQAHMLLQGLNAAGPQLERMVREATPPASEPDNTHERAREGVDSDAMQTAAAFWLAVRRGDDQRAMGLSTPGEFSEAKFQRLREVADLSEAGLEKVLASEQAAIAVTEPFPITVPGRDAQVQGRLGLTLARQGDRWLVRDADQLPDDETAEQWVQAFQEQFPDAEAVPPLHDVTDEPADHLEAGQEQPTRIQLDQQPNAAEHRQREGAWLYLDEVKLEDGAPAVYAWRIDAGKEGTLLHGWINYRADDTVAGHVGSGVTRYTGERPISISIVLEVRQANGRLMMEGGIRRAVDIPGAAEALEDEAVPVTIHMVGSRPTVPEGARLRMRTLPKGQVFAIGEAAYHTLWEGQWVRDGEVVGTIRYALRVADGDDPATGFYAGGEEHQRAAHPLPDAVQAGVPDGTGLQFRIVSKRGTLAELTEAMGVEMAATADHLVRTVEQHGPSRHEGSPFAWFPLREGLELQDPRMITAEHEGQTYLLLTNRQPLVMWPMVDGERQWRLESVSVAEDQQGRTAVAFALDKAGGEMMRQLSGENIGQSMAVLLDGEVLAAPTLQGTIAERGQITGSFSDEEIERMVEQLQQGVGAVDGR